MASTLPASDRTIDLWLAFYHEIDDQRLHAQYRELLTDEERGREPRFYFADDQRRYLVTRALVRTVLSRYAAVAPRDWRFSANAHGRPTIANVLPPEGALSFNISHARGLIALAVTRDREIGVDVENVRAKEVALEIADRFFAPAEVAELAALPQERRRERFFEYWTFKESYIKARGMGLAIPLGRFSFHYPHERAVTIAIQPELGDEPGRWRFRQFRPTADHLLALCAERRDGTMPGTTVRKVVPLLSEEVLQLPIGKASADWPGE